MYDVDDKTKAIDLPMSYLLGKPPIKPINIIGYNQKNHSEKAFLYEF